MIVHLYCTITDENWKYPKMGFIFQQPTLLKNLNILNNIILPSMRDQRSSNGQVVEKARVLMKQLQRVGICRALMSQPKIIFGDEPTGALNSKAADEIMRMLAEIHRRGTTILLVTHDAKVAARTERVLFMLDGQIAGEYLAEAYDEGRTDLKTHEERLTSWLTQMNF